MTGTAHSTTSQGAQDRGVSDTVAFVLMFAIIITGVGIVSLGAFDNLSEFSEREQIDNSERGLAAAAATLDNLHRQNDTRRSFALALGGGSVFLNDSTVEISAGGSNGEFDATYQVNAIEHRFDRSPEDITVAYEAGTVFRSPGFGARYGPSVECRSGDRVIISLVKLEADNFAISRGSENTVVLNPYGLPGESPVADLDDTLLFSAEVVDQNRTVSSSVGGQPIRVNVDRSAVPEQWRTYFDRTDGWVSGSTDDEWVCPNVDTALVRVTTVRLSL